jgi:16S rRNA (uracil1498-N3)-methyltransferase
VPRVFLAEVPRHTASFRITGQEARYVLTVLRMKAGEELSIIGPDGGLWAARIVGASGNSLEVEVLGSQETAAEPRTGIALLQGILKGRKMDLVVQKAVELGVKSIFPLVTERSQVRDTRRHERWQKVALEAARQCGRSAVPEVHAPAYMMDCLGALKGGIRGFIFWEEGGRALPLEGIPAGEDNVYAAIGPEGGFTREEVAMARKAGLSVATLGPLTLRAETAAISAMALMQFMMGRMR